MPEGSVQLSDPGRIATIVLKAMPRAKMGEKRDNSTGATVGYETQLWRMADALRDVLLPKLISSEFSVRDVSAGALQQ